MRGGMIFGLAAAMGVTTVAADERRELGAHEHGHSTLNIAVEGTRVALELMAPGMDIVGFEHAAATDEQKTAIAQAKAALANPLSLFALPQAAGCRVAEAHVGLETEDHAGGHRAEGEVRSGDEGHAEFHAEYALDCASPAALDAITFTFFDRFPNAEEVEVNLVTERGQKTFEVERDAPRLVLDGLT